MVLVKFILSLFFIAVAVLLFLLIAFGGTAIYMLKKALRFMKNGESAEHIHVHRKGKHTEENIIIDTKGTDKRNQQIFTDDEGEYVEYEESK